MENAASSAYPTSGRSRENQIDAKLYCRYSDTCLLGWRVAILRSCCLNVQPCARHPSLGSHKPEKDVLISSSFTKPLGNTPRHAMSQSAMHSDRRGNWRVSDCTRAFPVEQAVGQLPMCLPWILVGKYGRSLRMRPPIASESRNEIRAKARGLTVVCFWDCQPVDHLTMNS